MSVKPGPRDNRVSGDLMRRPTTINLLRLIAVLLLPVIMLSFVAKAAQSDRTVVTPEPQ